MVEYKSRDDVREAIRMLDGAILHDRRVRIVEVDLHQILISHSIP